jgi:hypothetical protein
METREGLAVLATRWIVRIRKLEERLGAERAKLAHDVAKAEARGLRTLALDLLVVLKHIDTVRDYTRALAYEGERHPYTLRQVLAPAASVTFDDGVTAFVGGVKLTVGA